MEPDLALLRSVAADELIDPSKPLFSHLKNEDRVGSLYRFVGKVKCDNAGQTVGEIELVPRNSTHETQGAVVDRAGRWLSTPLTSPCMYAV